MGACRSLGPRGPHVDGGGGAPWCPSLVTGHLSGQKVQVDCAGAAAHETLTPRTSLKTFRAIWGKARKSTQMAEREAAMGGEGPEGRETPTQAAFNRKSLLPLPSSDRPVAPSP